MTKKEFFKRYKPEKHPDGSLYVMRDPGKKADRDVVQKAISEYRIWSAIEDEHGMLCLVNGIYRHDLLYCVITEVPWKAGQSLVVQDPPKYVKVRVVSTAQLLLGKGVPLSYALEALEVRSMSSTMAVTVCEIISVKKIHARKCSA